MSCRTPRKPTYYCPHDPEELKASVPAPPSVMEEMFLFVYDQLELMEKPGMAWGCDHTLRFTCEFIRNHDLNKYAVLGWLAEHDVYCDCQMMRNVAVPWTEDDDDDDEKESSAHD